MFKKIWLLLGSIFFSVGVLLGVIAAGIFAFIASRHDQLANTEVTDWIPVIVLLPLALTFGSLGAIFLLYHAHKKRRHRWLLDFGTPVWANVLGFEDNWNIQVNGRPATVLVASYGNMQFVSGPLDNNDRMHIGEHVKVLLHPDNNNKYTFDFMNESNLIPFEPPQPLQGTN